MVFKINKIQSMDAFFVEIWKWKLCLTSFSHYLENKKNPSISIEIDDGNLPLKLVFVWYVVRIYSKTIINNNRSCQNFSSLLDCLIWLNTTAWGAFNAFSNLTMAAPLLNFLISSVGKVVRQLGMMGSNLISLCKDCIEAQPV